MVIQIRRVWRVQGEDADLVHASLVDTDSGDETELKLRQRRNPALFKFVRAHVSDIPTEPAKKPRRTPGGKPPAQRD